MDALFKNSCSVQYRQAVSVHADRSILEGLRRLGEGDSEITFQVDGNCLSSAACETDDSDEVLVYVSEALTAESFIESVIAFSTLPSSNEPSGTPLSVIQL